MKIKDYCYDIQREPNLVSYFLRASSLKDLPVILIYISEFFEQNKFSSENLICSVYIECAAVFIYPANNEDDHSPQEFYFTISIDDWLNIQEFDEEAISSAVDLLLPFAKEVEQSTEKLAKIAHYVWDDLDGLTLQYDKASKYA